MDDPKKPLHSSSRPQNPKKQQSRNISRISNISNKLSNKSADQSLIRNDISKEENTRVNSSAHDYNQSNYFNSMLSDKGFSKIDLDDEKWLHKSMSRDSNEESFEHDSVLPAKLATRLKTLIENDAKRMSLKGSDDELLAHSPDRKILERGKEMVRKSGYDVDFTGKLISKDATNSNLDQFMNNTKYNTSLDLGMSKENKLWLENRITNDQFFDQKEPKLASMSQGFHNDNIEIENKVNSENEIQGITSTKYSDLYCQENYENMKVKQFRFDSEFDQINNVEEKELNEGEMNIEVQDSQTHMNQTSQYHENEKTSIDKDELRKDNKIELRKLNTMNSKQSSNSRKISIDRSETDFFDNGSFLNMGDNNSLVIGMETERNSIRNSIDGSHFSKSRTTTQHHIENENNKIDSFSHLKEFKRNSTENDPKSSLYIESEKQLIEMELPSTLPFEAGPEYESMVSSILDPGKVNSSSDQFAKKNLIPSDLVHTQLQQNMIGEEISKEYYDMGDINPENEYGQFNSNDIREYLRSYARDPDHLCQLLIEQKMGRLDIMDKISEEQSMDMDNSFITHAVNKSLIFKDPKLMHSDSWWLGTRQVGSNRAINTNGRNVLNTSNNLSRDLNSSFKLITSQGDLGTSRNDDQNLSGFLLRNSSFKYKKFPTNRKISLKVDGKEFQETQLFHVPENKNTKSSKRIYSSNIGENIARLKVIRNSDGTVKRKQNKILKTHSRSLNSSGIHSMSKKSKADCEDFNFNDYSVNNHNNISLKPFEVGPKSESLQVKKNLPSIHTEEKLKSLSNSINKDYQTKKSEKDLKLLEKRNSEIFSDEADFEFSCVELNESKENNFDTESMRQIIDLSMQQYTQNPMITYGNQKGIHNDIHFNVTPNIGTDFKKIKIGNEMVNERNNDTTESWMKYPSSNMHGISEIMHIPRKISDIPVMNSNKRGSLIVYGGEFTPGHKRSEVIEKNFGKDSHFDYENEIKSNIESQHEPKQNITDLMKMIIQKTENLSTVEEVSPRVNETSVNELTNENISINKNSSQEIQIVDLKEEKESQKKEEKDEFSEQFDSCITNLPSIVNIESTANLQTIFDINFEPENFQVKEKSMTKIDKISESQERADPNKGSMLSDEYNTNKEIFRVVSQTDNECDSVNQNNSILLMTNEEIARKRSTEQWVDKSVKTNESEMESFMVLQSVISNLEDNNNIPWVEPNLLSSSKKNCFKKQSGSVLPKAKFQEIMESNKTSSLKQKYRSSKLGKKITRMSRKAPRNETFKMKSPTNISIINHSDLSDLKNYSPKSQLKISLSKAKQKKIKDKLWESLVSSKKTESIDTNSRFDKTLGSLSIQSLLKNSKKESIKMFNRKRNKRKISNTDKDILWKSRKSGYKSGSIKQSYIKKANLLKDKIVLLSLTRNRDLKDTKSSSRFMMNSKHESNSIYSKISHPDEAKKEIHRSSTIHHQSQDYSYQTDFDSVQFKDEHHNEINLISNDPSQRELNADILRTRNKKEVRSKFQNIYEPKNDPKKEFSIHCSGKSLDNDKRQKRISNRNGVFSRTSTQKIKSSKQNTVKYTPSGGVDSLGKESDTSSLFYQHKNNGNDSGFLPFPRSIKLKDDQTNLSKMSEMKDNGNFRLKDFYSGKMMGYNQNQREEYGILSVIKENKIDTSPSNTQTKWSLNISESKNGPDNGSLKSFNQPPTKTNNLNKSQPHKHTFSQLTIKSFKSKQSLKEKIKESMKIIKEQDQCRIDSNLNPASYSGNLMRNMIKKKKEYPIDQCLYEASFKGGGRGKSSDVVKSSKDIFWKANNTKNNNQQEKLNSINKGYQKNKLISKLSSMKNELKKKQVRYSLNDSKKKSKNIRDRLLKQLIPKKVNHFNFSNKNYKSNIQSEILENTKDSLIIRKQNKTNQSLKIKELPYKTIVTKKDKKEKLLRKFDKKVKKAKDKKEKKKTFEKKPKKKKSQKEKFLEFQKRKIEKEIRSFHSLEPSSISNMLNIKKEMSIPSYTHNKPVELTNNIYPEFKGNNGHIYNINEVKIDKIVSSPQVFNYYYMSPNYNLKLPNLDPNATLEIPQNFQSNPYHNKIRIKNHINPSLNVISLWENEQHLKMNKKNSKLKEKLKIKKKTLHNVKRIKEKKASKFQPKIKKNLSKKSYKAKTKELNIMTGMYSDLGSYIEETSLTPSFFKKKKLFEIHKSNLLSQEPSHINNINQPQKITFGILPKPYEKLTDAESSMSIPLNKSSMLSKDNTDYDLNFEIIDESPLIKKEIIPRKKMLYSSIAFPMSSSVDTSEKLSKLISKDKKQMKKFDEDDSKKNLLNKSSNLEKKNIIKRLKSKRKIQIQKLKERTGSKLLKKQYNKVKKTSRKYSQKPKRKNMLMKGASFKDSNPLNFPVNHSIIQIKSEKKRDVEDLQNANDEFEKRIISSMRNTADAIGLPSKPNGFISGNLMSSENSKIHSNMLENVFKEKKEQTIDKQSDNSNLTIFKQRMSSNVELDRKYFLLEERGSKRTLNRSLFKQNQFPREYGEFKKKKFNQRNNKYSWRDGPTSSLRKNTSLDLVLKKKSIKFIDMHKKILKNINKEVKNIYRLSSPSLKNFEDSISKMDSLTLLGNKVSKQEPVRKKNTKKSQKAKYFRRFQKKENATYRLIGSLDFDDAKNKDMYPTAFEKSIKIFKDNLREIKKIKNPVFKKKSFGTKRFSNNQSKNFGSFKISNKKKSNLLRNNSKMKKKNIPKGSNRIKHYCSSQAQNTLPNDIVKGIRVKFNKSTFCDPAQQNMNSEKGITQKEKSNQDKKSKMLKIGSLRSTKNKNKYQGSSKGISTNFFSNYQGKMYSGKNSYTTSKKNIMSKKSIQMAKKMKDESLKGNISVKDNYFSITSEEKSQNLNLIPSMISIKTDNSLFSHNNKDNDEFNLYCADESSPMDNSGSQTDIIYNKKPQIKRKIIKTEHGLKSKKTNSSKMFFQGVKSNSRNNTGLRKKIWKERSFNKQNN